MKKLFLLIIASSFITTAVNANNNLPTLENESLAEVTIQPEVREVKVFYWEVECEFGKASGTSPSLKKAQKMVKLVSEKDIMYGELIGNGLIKVK